MTNEELIQFIEDTEEPIAVRLFDETVWLTQKQIIDLFQSSKANISEHITKIYKNNELEQSTTVRKFRTVQQEGTRIVNRDIEHYNLDVIISIGYKVNTKRGIQFRKWATKILREKLLKKYKKSISPNIHLTMNIGENGTFLISNNTIGSITNSFNDLIKILDSIDDASFKKDAQELKGLVENNEHSKIPGFINKIKKKIVSSEFSSIGKTKLIEFLFDQFIK